MPATSRVKLVQYLAGAETYGQILLGLSKPCADLSRGASEDDILGVAAILGLQAIEYRKLYPARPGATRAETARSAPSH